MELTHSTFKLMASSEEVAVLPKVQEKEEKRVASESHVHSMEEKGEIEEKSDLPSASNSSTSNTETKEKLDKPQSTPSTASPSPALAIVKPKAAKSPAKPVQEDKATGSKSELIA